jgi:hypothetical protein
VYTSLHIHARELFDVDLGRIKDDGWIGSTGIDAGIRSILHDIGDISYVTLGNSYVYPFMVLLSKGLRTVSFISKMLGKLDIIERDFFIFPINPG